VKQGPYAQRALERWCESKKLYVEEVRFLGGTLRMARAFGVKSVTAEVRAGANEGYLVRIYFRPKRTATLEEWRGIAARCLGSREEAWRAAGKLAYLLEAIGAASSVRYQKTKVDALLAKFDKENP
jgi:hypothetical protein